MKLFHIIVSLWCIQSLIFHINFHISLSVTELLRVVEESPSKEDDNQEGGNHRALFYNIFFKKAQSHKTLAIIQEQMDQIRNSSLANSTIYYNTIGFNDSFCPPDLKCRNLNFYPKANEEVTLQSLHEYCQKHPQARVSYIHNKGSFSQRDMRFLRHHATKAALSDQCSNSTCNVCGMIFQSTPYFHFSSNMWTAQCSYVKNLVSPLEYEPKRRALCQSTELDRRMKDHADKNPFCPSSNNAINDDDNDPGKLAMYGFSRYSAERWITSHPSLVPCSLFPGNIGSCRSCDWEENLSVARRKRPKFTFYHWQTLAVLLAEYELMYSKQAPTRAEDGNFCKTYFGGFKRNACSISEFNESQPFISLTDI